MRRPLRRRAGPQCSRSGIRRAALAPGESGLFQLYLWYQARGRGGPGDRGAAWPRGSTSTAGRRAASAALWGGPGGRRPAANVTFIVRWLPRTVESSSEAPHAQAQSLRPSSDVRRHLGSSVTMRLRTSCSISNESIMVS